MSDSIPLEPSFTLILGKPVNFEGRDYAQLVLQEPTAKSVLRAEEQLRNGVNAPSLRNREIYLVAFASGAPVPVIEMLKISELNRAMAYINPFLVAGQGTGAS